MAESRLSSPSPTSATQCSLLDGLGTHPFSNEIKSLKDIKKIISIKTVRAKLLFTVAAGLPYSGTTTFLRKMLSCPEATQESAGKLLDIYPIVFFKDSVINSGHILHLNDEDQNDGMLILALAKLLKTKQFKLNIVQDTSVESEKYFDNSEVNSLFTKFCAKFIKFWSELENSPEGSSNPLVALAQSQSYINFLDVNVNKAVYEYLFLVGKRLQNGFLINVIDLHYYNRTVLDKQLKLSDSHYKNKYERAEVSLFGCEPAIHYFISTIEATLAEHRHEQRALIVGTNLDQFETDKKKEEAIKQAQKCIDSHATEVDIIEATYPRIIPVSNITEDQAHTNVFKSLVTLIEARSGHHNYVVLKHMFFYYVLKSTKQMFMTREVAINYGEKCEMKSDEIKDCLQILHDSCFIFCVNEKFVVLNVPQFISGLDKLYHLSTQDCDGFNPEFGFVSDTVLKELWGYNPDKDNSPYHLYSKTLRDLGLMVRAFKGSANFFMPSLRTEHKELKMSANSTSLYIEYNIYILPCHYLCRFANQFVRSDKMQKPVEIMNTKYYNALRLNFPNWFNVSISFHKNCIEVSLEMTSKDSVEEAYSLVKENCIQVLKSISSTNILKLRYNLAISCPNETCLNQDGSVHLINIGQGEIARKSELYVCNQCNSPIKDSTKFLWIEAAPKEIPIHDDDSLSAENISAITDHLLKKYPGEATEIITYLQEKCMPDNLKLVPDTFKKEKDKLFHALYISSCENKWKSRNNLATILRKKEFNLSAQFLDSGHYQDIIDEDVPSRIEDRVISTLADAWTDPQSELAKILEVSYSDIAHETKTKVEECTEIIHSWIDSHPKLDQKKKLKIILENEEYYNMVELIA